MAYIDVDVDAVVEVEVTAQEWIDGANDSEIKIMQKLVNIKLGSQINSESRTYDQERFNKKLLELATRYDIMSPEDIKKVLSL